MNLTTSCSSSKIVWIGALLCLSLLQSSGYARAQDGDINAEIPAPSSFDRLIGAGKEAGWTALRGVATADYRGYDLEDLLPVEQVFLPRIAPPIERHPSLLFPQQQVGLIRDRIHHEPYASWWQIILKRAESGLMEDLTDPGLGEFRRATAAKACAFAFVISGDSLFLEKARQGLLHISPPPAVTTPEGGKQGRGWGDWIRASALMLTYCVAYDLVAEDLTPQERLSVARKLAAEADQLYRNLKFSPPNNHKTIMAVAVGTAALTIPSYGSGQPRAWLDAAMINLRSGLAQIDRDGSYREGVFYGGYVSRLLFPFAFYLQRTTGHDLFSHRRLEDLVQWLIRIRRPDGGIPLFDDAWQQKHAFLPILVGQSRLGGVARWLHENSPQRTSEYLMEVEFICAFDQRVAPQQPPWERTAFFPDGGMAVLGDDWSSTGTYLLLQAEGTRALASGHEHLDPGHFVLQAGGQDLLIDTGAGPRGQSSEGRSWYLSAEAHNMLLVDGKGPSGNPFSNDESDGELFGCFRSEQLSAAAVKTRYRGADIQRTFHFLGGSYFLIFDQLSASDPHDYELVLHGLGPAQTPQPNTVVWSPDGRELEVEFLAPEKTPLELSLRTGQRTPGFGSWESHTYVRAKRSRRKKAHFSTLLLPHGSRSHGLESADLPILSPGRAQAREISGDRLQGARHLVLATDGHQATARGVTTNALLSVTGFDPRDERLFFVSQQGTFYQHLGDTCYVADRPISISMITERDRWAGYVQTGEDQASIRLETGFDPGQVRFGHYPVPYQYQDGKVQLSLNGSGPLELGPGPPLIFTPQASRERYPFLEQLAWQDEPMVHWEELTPEAQFLAQVQALDVAIEQSGEPVRDLSQKMGLGPNGLRQALGMATGLAAKAYDPDRWARLNLPEHLEGHKDCNWGELSYGQDGYLTEDGLRLERLEGRFSGGAWGSVTAGHYSPYPEIVHRTLRLELAEVSLGAGQEKMQSQERWQYSALHSWKEVIWGLEGYTLRGSQDYGLSFLLRGSRWTTEISQYRRPETPRGRRLLIARRGRTFSPQAELVDPGADREKDLRIGWTSAPLGNLTWEFSSLSGCLSGISQLRQLSSVVSGQGKSVSGRVRGHYRKGAGSIGQGTILIKGDRSRWTLGTSFDQRRRPAITEENLSFFRDWASWLGSTLGVTHFPRTAPEDDRLLLSCSAHLRPESVTVIHLRLEGDSSRKRQISWGMGLDRWGRLTWGGGWADEWTPEGRRRWHLSAHGGITNSGGAGIRGRAEIELTTRGETEAYEIEIQQQGSSFSPGLLFTKDPLTGVRNDGFIRFRF